MNNILELLRDNLMIVLSAVAFILIVLIVVVSLVEKKRNKKNKIITNQIEVFDDTVSNSTELDENIEMLDVEVLDELVPNSHPELVIIEKDAEELKIDAQKEINGILEGNILIEAEDALTKFEKEQEDTAIISYEELKQKTEMIYSNDYNCEEDAILNLDELTEKFKVNDRKENDLDLCIQSLDMMHDTKEEVSNIYNSVISEDFNYNVNIELENTANLEKLDLEIRNATGNKLNEEIKEGID